MSEQSECPGVDKVCFLGVVMPDGSVPVIRHTRNHGNQIGELRPLEDGKPVNGALVEVEGSGKPGDWCQMKPLISSQEGPAMVNSREYKDGWTSIFGHQDYGQA